MPAPVRAAALVPAERLLLGLLLRGAEGIDEALGELSEADVGGLQSAPVLRAAKGLYLRNEAITAAALAAAVEEEARTLLTALAMVDGPSDGVLAPRLRQGIEAAPRAGADGRDPARLEGGPPRTEHEALLLRKERAGPADGGTRVVVASLRVGAHGRGRV